MGVYVSKVPYESCHYLGGENNAKLCKVICQEFQSNPVTGLK